MQRKRPPTPKTIRANDELWATFTASCKADGRYPRHVIEAFALRWEKMTAGERTELMAVRAEWEAMRGD